MKIDTNRFRIAPGSKVRLDRLPTDVKPYYDGEADYALKLQKSTLDLSRLQQRLYAADRHSLLVILQAMDAAGKDGLIRHVMSGLNPQGCQVFSFKHPSAEELDHDFMWRCAKALPERGRIGIFNRSYFEEVLIVRVHPEILRGQKVPDKDLADLDTVWKERYQSIRDLERHLQRNGTCVLKIFLHLSRKEQAKRFLERIDDPEKNWKFSAQDIEERRYWGAYMDAYSACLQETSTAHAPWYAVPADDKENARLIASHILVEALKRLKPAYPTLDRKRRRELVELRKRLAK